VTTVALFHPSRLASRRKAGLTFRILKLVLIMDPRVPVDMGMALVNQTTKQSITEDAQCHLLPTRHAEIGRVLCIPIAPLRLGVGWGQLIVLSRSIACSIVFV